MSTIMPPSSQVCVPLVSPASSASRCSCRAGSCPPVSPQLPRAVAWASPPVGFGCFPRNRLLFTGRDSAGRVLRGCLAACSLVVAACLSSTAASDNAAPWSCPSSTTWCRCPAAPPLPLAASRDITDAASVSPRSPPPARGRAASRRAAACEAWTRLMTDSESHDTLGSWLRGVIISLRGSLSSRSTGPTARGSHSCGRPCEGRSRGWLPSPLAGLRS